MARRQFLDRAAEFFLLRDEHPALLEARCKSLSRLVPLMYFILIVNSWVLAIGFIGVAPMLLTLVTPLLLTSVCVIRIALWWRSRGGRGAAGLSHCCQLRLTHLLSGVLSLCFLAWGSALFVYGDAFGKSHVGIFIAMSTLGAMFCLVHARTAAFIVGALAAGASIGLFALAEAPSLMAMSINVLMVVGAAMILVYILDRGFVRMVHAQIAAEQRQEEQGRLLRMLDDMPVAVMTVDPQTFTITYANRTSIETLGQIEHLLPIEAETLVGQSIDVFHKHPEHQRRILADPANLPHTARIRLGPEVLDLQVTAVTSSDGAYLGPMLSWAIVTKEVEAEDRLQWLAHHDTLTRLPSRGRFHERLEELLAAPDPRFSLLFVDLDGFKLVNDTLGHIVGDAVLVQVAERMEAECAGHGIALGRLGGDEFALIVPEIDRRSVAEFADGLIAALSVPYRLADGRQVTIGASIGIAAAPAHGAESKLLLSRADIALSAAKATGKRTSRLFAPEMEERVRERVTLEAELREALRTDQGLFVYYQPIIEIATGRITTREALVRWKHPVRGWIAPGTFVPIAEQCGLIGELGRFVLDRACRDAATWDDDARVAVNVSPGQLGDGALAHTVLSALMAAGLPPSRLEIEITETALLSEEAKNMQDLRRLREAGVRVALDDFGTGYSSLAHLRAFPFDKIKIDGSFVRDAVHRPDCAAVVRVVAELGRELGVTTVAEGVETARHLMLATELGCTEVQGHFFGSAVPNDAQLFGYSRKLAVGGIAANA